MKLFLAGTSSFREIAENKSILYVLESFYYFKEWQLEYIKKCKMFLLDSGAFTFINSNSVFNFDNYIRDYIEFINKNDIRYFFELDIDSVVGYKKVVKYRELLERETRKKSIPVWHINRGKDEWINLCENYDYIGLGGIAIGEIKKKDWKYFDWFINEAHKRNCKVHGLGFTSYSGMQKYRFDTVDSTAWTSGGRFGTLYKFIDGKMLSFQKKNGMRGKRDKMNENNLCEWIKFQKYAEENL